MKKFLIVAALLAVSSSSLWAQCRNVPQATNYSPILKKKVVSFSNAFKFFGMTAYGSQIVRGLNCWDTYKNQYVTEPNMNRADNYDNFDSRLSPANNPKGRVEILMNMVDQNFHIFEVTNIKRSLASEFNGFCAYDIETVYSAQNSNDAQVIKVQTIQCYFDPQIMKP